MNQLRPFEKAYLSFLQKRKDKGLVLKRPNVEAKVRLYPVAREYDYAKWLSTIFDFPLPTLKQIAKQKAAIFLTDRADEEGQEGALAIFGAELAQSQADLLASQIPVLSVALLGFAESIHEFSDKQWQKTAMASIGEAWDAEDLWAKPMLEEWRLTQISLIESVGIKQAEIVATIVSDGVRQGRHMADIATDLEIALQTLSRTKAKLIARDQVGKLYGMMAEKEDTEAGIEEYDWSDAHDERVRGNPAGTYKNARPSHWIMHKRTCLWSNSAVWWENGAFVPRAANAPLVHPGMAIQCRCVSISRVDLLFDKLEKLVK